MKPKFSKTNGELMLEAVVYRFWAGVIFKVLIAVALIKYVFGGVP